MCICVSWYFHLKKKLSFNQLDSLLAVAQNPKSDAGIHYFHSTSVIFIFQEWMWAVDQKHHYHSDWPYFVEILLNKKIWYGNLVEGFRINLKTF